MAKIVLGLGTSHTNMITEPPEFWHQHGNNDKRSRELISPRSFQVLPYEQLLAEADPRHAQTQTLEHFTGQYNQLIRGIDVLSETLRSVNPDAVIIITDDQDEIMFEDNMPAFWVYWGDQMKLVKRHIPDSAPEFIKQSMWSYGDVTFDVPVRADLAKHMVEFLNDAEFDISHSRYLREEYGGAIGPAGYVGWRRETQARPMGMPHGFSFIVRRMMDNKPLPIVPVLINTCYPPNQPAPRRCYAFGKAIRAAVESWDSDARVAVIASGGLSHFTLDEETDWMLLRGLQNKDAEALCSLPKERLNSASSEIRNWIAAAGALEHLDFELIEYVPVARTPAGTGGGWGFGRWQ
ncbi:MAG: extradiol ring-cleavage dioxygenase [Dehalococcoidia bacterium]|nr:extradiol ring-cleavage dioxygenase [Dehalococcoidia bacterium]